MREFRGLLQCVIRMVRILSESPTFLILLEKVAGRVKSRAILTRSAATGCCPPGKYGKIGQASGEERKKSDLLTVGISGVCPTHFCSWKGCLEGREHCADS